MVMISVKIDDMHEQSIVFYDAHNHISYDLALCTNHIPYKLPRHQSDDTEDEVE